MIGLTTNLSSSMTLTNATIQAGTNPTFLGNITIQGILFIQAPNVVRFTRNVSLQGIIVANGDASNPGTNSISFEGNFASGGYPSGSQFDAIRQEQGSSILAPGFGVVLHGQLLLRQWRPGRQQPVLLGQRQRRGQRDNDQLLAERDPSSRATSR